MKLGSVLLLVSITGLGGCSEKPKDVTPDRVKSDQNGKWHLDGKPWSGKHISKFSNKKTSFEGELIEGHPHGNWTWYYESGRKKSQLIYELGLKDGNETHYFDNANNTRMRVKTWDDGAFVKRYQWQEDGTPILPDPQPDTNGTVRAVP